MELVCAHQLGMARGVTGGMSPAAGVVFEDHAGMSQAPYAWDGLWALCQHVPIQRWHHACVSPASRGDSWVL